MMTEDETTIQVTLGFLDSCTEPGTGFLPAKTPLHTLPPPFSEISEACAELAGRYHGEGLDCRPWLDKLFAEKNPSWEQALTEADTGLLENLMTKTSLLCHAYRWQSVPTSKENYELESIKLPAGLEWLWTEIAKRLDVPRVGLFYTMICNNWKLEGVAPDSEYQVEDIGDKTIDLVHSWLNPPVHEELRTFVIAALNIEAKGSRILQSIKEIYDCILRQDGQEATYHLMKLSASILAINTSFNQSIKKTRLAPNHFLEYVQPTMIWLLDQGEGPLEGASGPQSCTIQILDSFFGVSRESGLGKLVLESRRYMLPQHRKLLKVMDGASPILRSFVEKAGSPRLLEAYNRCLALMKSWRVSHQKRGMMYIEADVASKSYVSTGLLVHDNEDKVGVFDRSMEDHIQATDACLLDGDWKGKEWSLNYLFRFLTEEQRALLASNTETIRVQAGEAIISQGELFPGLFELKSGTASVKKKAGQEEQVVDSLSVDEVFGEMSLVENLPASASIVADVDLEVQQVSLETVYDLINVHRDAEGGFYLALAQLISHRLRKSFPASGQKEQRQAVSAEA